MTQAAAIFLMGPTASGKTAAALALAQIFPVEIISVDSALVYTDMNIGTAKPDAATLAAAPHYLIDLILPTQSYSAAQFCADALPLMAEITARGRIPLLVGGTMLYFKALREGLSNLPEADPAIRAAIDAEAAERGWDALHRDLLHLDPLTAARLQPGDSQRIQRALEIIRITGKTMSECLAQGRETELPYRVLPLALMPSARHVLHERIAQRFDTMLADGLVDELSDLRDRYDLHADLPSMRCVGYRQVWSYQGGEYGYNEMRDRGIFATRQLAKRQMTWLRNMSGIVTMDCLDDSLTPDLVAAIDGFLRVS